jgi:hypothetical protein
MKTSTDNVLTKFNNLHKNLQFTMEKENNKKVNYLDITILRKTMKLIFNIYRKSTTTSTAIHSTSCHPTEHKIAAFNYLYNRVNQYPILNYQKHNELNIIHQIATENKYKNNKTLQE